MTLDHWLIWLNHVKLNPFFIWQAVGSLLTFWALENAPDTLIFFRFQQTLMHSGSTHSTK